MMGPVGSVSTYVSCSVDFVGYVLLVSLTSLDSIIPIFFGVFHKLHPMFGCGFLYLFSSTARGNLSENS